MSQHVVVRHARRGDLDEIVRIERVAWPEGTRASREQFEQRLEVYPEGFYVAEAGPALAGALTSQRIGYEPGEAPRGWETTTNKGWIRATHRPEGNALYVVSVGVHPSHRERGVGAALVRAAQEHAERANLSHVLLDSRIPGYSEARARKVAVECYVFSARPDGRPADAELRFYARLGFGITSPSQIVAGCMTHDSESATYGVRMVWPAR